MSDRRLSEINNDKIWLITIWYLGFGTFAAGAFGLFVYAAIDLITLHGMRAIVGWMFWIGLTLLLLAAAIDVPLAYIRRRRIKRKSSPSLS